MNIGLGQKIRVWQLKLVYPILYGVGTFESVTLGLGLQILEFCTLSSEIKYKQPENLQTLFAAIRLRYSSQFLILAWFTLCEIQ